MCPCWETRPKLLYITKKAKISISLSFPSTILKAMINFLGMITTYLQRFKTPKIYVGKQCWIYIINISIWNFQLFQLNPSHKKCYISKIIFKTKKYFFAQEGSLFWELILCSHRLKFILIETLLFIGTYIHIKQSLTNPCIISRLRTYVVKLNHDTKCDTQNLFYFIGFHIFPQLIYFSSSLTNILNIMM